MTISLSNYKEWLPFAFIIVGTVLALISLLLPRGKQRRQNTLKLLATFRASLHEHDVDHWKEIFHGTREAASAPAGYFINRLGKPVPLESMWTAGNDDHTAIQRMAECLEKICAEMLTDTADSKMIWYEIGQLMETMHGWLEEIPGVQRDLTFLEEQYPSIKQVFEKFGHRFNKWPFRVYAKR
jgi:hypothetical protein